MRTVSSRTYRRPAAIFVASAAVLFVAACGGSSGDSSSDSNNGNGGGDQAFAAYTQCMQKNGVTTSMPTGGPGGSMPSGMPSGGFPSNMPRPSGSFPGGSNGGFPGGGMFQKPDNVDQATWDKAQSACASVRPSFGGGRNGGGNGQNAAFQNCLKEHGVTATAGNLDTNDATVKKALETCQVLQQPQASATPAS